MVENQNGQYIVNEFLLFCLFSYKLNFTSVAMWLPLSVPSVSFFSKLFTSSIRFHFVFYYIHGIIYSLLFYNFFLSSSSNCVFLSFTATLFLLTLCHPLSYYACPNSFSHPLPTCSHFCILAPRSLWSGKNLVLRSYWHNYKTNKIFIRKEASFL